MNVSQPRIVINHTFSLPESNLALDEVLLRYSETTGHGILRFWEPTIPCVVLGIGGKAEKEVWLDYCRSEKISVLRRISGGGTVLQLPGCLSYCLSLPLEGDESLGTIQKSNQFIMKKHCLMMQSFLPGPVTVEGVTDLSWKGRKFSGNAQKRTKRALIFHGTFLLSADLDFLGKALKHPPSMPDWRKNRNHKEFLTNIPVKVTELKHRLAEVWNAQIHQGIEPFMREVENISKSKYTDVKWNYRF